MRLLSYCLMPNHWHLVLWPRADGELSDFVHWLTLTQTQRWHAHYRDVGAGHLNQGRYKSFPIADDEHYLKVCRYVERNALRAGLVSRAEEWLWDSLARRRGIVEGPTLCAGPLELPAQWLRQVNRPQTEAELESLRAARPTVRQRSMGPNDPLFLQNNCPLAAPPGNPLYNDTRPLANVMGEQAMSFFLFWGSYAIRDERGMVADHCAKCGQVNRFLVTDHSKINHVFFIPTSEKQRVSSSRRCQTCGSEDDCGSLLTALTGNGTAYKCFLAAPSATAMPLDELLRQTNPRLARIEESRREIEAIAQQDPQAVRKAHAFMREVAPSFPGLTAGFVRSVFYMVLLCSLIWILPIPEKVGCTIFTVMLVFPIVGGITIFRTIRRQTRQWFQDRVIAEAARRGVDLDILVMQLSTVDATDQSVSHKLQYMAGNVQVLKDLLGKEAK